MKVWLVAVLWLAGLQACVAPAVAQCRAGHRGDPWPGWQHFQETLVARDGRVIDPQSPRSVSTSEAQAYALFFALVANDRERFEQILGWTQDNLAAGDLTQHLPAWLWGRKDDASWGVLDANPAADADLWIVYALGEAGRLWQERRYQALASLLAERVLREETQELPGLGRTLLPGPQGFALAGPAWRLNPSYTPLFLVRWLQLRSADARWAAVLRSSLRVLQASAPQGYVADWLNYRASPVVEGAVPTGYFDTNPLEARDQRGSYDAIRAYLWLGMSSAADPQRAALLRDWRAMASQLAARGLPPEVVDVRDGSVTGTGSPGFSAALLPFLRAQGLEDAARTQEARARTAPRADAYYEQALRLFGLGWQEARFAFAPDGGLLPAWQPCADTPATP